MRSSFAYIFGCRGSVDHDTFLQHDICVDCFFTCRDDAVSGFCFFIESKTLDIAYGISTALVVFGDDLAIGVPDDRCSDGITLHYFHKCDGFFDISVERDDGKDSVEDLGNTVAVKSYNLAVLSHGFYREVTVGDDDAVAVAHFTQHFEKLGG